MVHRQNTDALIRLGFAFLLFVTYIYADVRIVNVGGNGGILNFDPQNITAIKGDVIRWEFKGGNHNVVQSDGLGSCDLSLTPGAFKSDTNPPSKIFEYNVVDQNTTIYYFCSYAGHCQQGMWGAIYVGTQPPPDANASPISSSTANSTQPTTTTTTTTTTPNNNNAIKFVYDFKLLTFIILISVFLIYN